MHQAIRYFRTVAGAEAWLPALAPIAAHYGPVNAVTFIVATNCLKSIDQPFENYATAFLPAMESPAILVGVVLGKLAMKQKGDAIGGCSHFTE